MEKLCLAYANRRDEPKVMQAVVNYDPKIEAFFLIYSPDELDLFNSLNLENLSFLLTKQEDTI